MSVIRLSSVEHKLLLTLDLTERERQVLEFYYFFQSSRKVAEALGCGKSTINDIMKRIRSRVNIFDAVYESDEPEEVVGIIGDTHLPYEHPEYLDFCKSTFKSNGVTKVIHIGDLIDNHDLSFHDSEPALLGATGERLMVQDKLGPWFDAFNELTLISGNHDLMANRKAIKAGIDPTVYMRPLPEVYGFPKGWKLTDKIMLNGVLYHHGETATGVNGFRNDAKDRMINTVTGHVHSNFGVSYTATEHRLVYGMAVGCGVDVKSMAFIYGKNFKKKPILGCGVVKKNGKLPLCFPMDLGEKW